MRRLCDKCGARRVKAGHTRPLIKIYGDPMKIKFDKGRCDDCHEDKPLCHYPDVKSP